jgi:hypothetical protein
VSRQLSILHRALRRRSLRIAVLAMILFGASVNFFCSNAFAQSPTLSSDTSRKEPKLSWLIRILRDQIPQETQLPGQTQQPRTSHGLSTQTLPKSIVDAMHSRQLRTNNNSEVQAYIELEGITPERIQKLEDLGIKIEVLGDPRSHQAKDRVYTITPTVQAWIPMAMLQQLEQLSFVRYVRLPDYAMSNGTSIDSQGDELLEAAYVRSTMSGLNLDGSNVTVGVISSGIGGIFASGCTSCGPVSGNATNPSPILLGDLPQATGVRTAGVLTAVSGGITAIKSYRDDQDLEATVEGSEGAEGTAMLEIVYDLAPKATLSFTNSSTSMEFELAVDALAQVNEVVVDDQFFAEPSFDGTSAVSTNTADALNNTSNQIRAYITSAGNMALDHYQGMYAPSGIDGLAITGFSGDLHLFQGMANDPQPAPGVTTDNENFGSTVFDPLLSIPPGQSVTVYLVWDDPVGASNNHYDLFLVPLSCGGLQAGRLPKPPCTITGSPVEFSENPQTGTQDPVQSIPYTNMGGSPVTLGIVIQNVENEALPVTFDMFVFGYGSKQTAPNHNFNTISGSIPAQSDAGGTPVSVISVGAINQIQCPSPDNCTGLLEGFSSQGPTQLTPQATTARIKPDLVAVDEVCIDGAGGFGNTIGNIDPGVTGICPVNPPASFTPMLFGGTSAAAPHVAAITALVLQAAPCLAYSSYNASASPPGNPATARESVYNALTKGYAQQLPGYLDAVQNNQEGWGIVDALTSVSSMLPQVMPPPTTANQTLSAVSASGAPVTLTGTAKDPNGCPLVAIQWSGGCGSGVASALHATVTCPIGVNTVQVGVSNNALSYLPQSQVPPLSITITDFALSGSPASANTPGSPAIYTIGVTSTSQGTFIYPVSLSCTAGLPAGAICSFSPIAVTPSATGAVTANSSSTLTIYQPNISSSNPRLFLLRDAGLAAVWLVSPFLLVAFEANRKGSHSTFRTRLFVSGVVLLILIVTASCSSHQSSTVSSPSPTTYTVMITGTANQLSHTTTITYKQ